MISLAAPGEIVPTEFRYPEMVAERGTFAAHPKMNVGCRPTRVKTGLML